MCRLEKIKSNHILEFSFTFNVGSTFYILNVYTIYTLTHAYAPAPAHTEPSQPFSISNEYSSDMEEETETERHGREGEKGRVRGKVKK